MFFFYFFEIVIVLVKILRRWDILAPGTNLLSER